MLRAKADMQSSVSLISLAMLKVNAEEQNRDYLDYLVPFIQEAIAIGKVEQVNDVTVQEALQSIYGLNIPRQIVSLCLKRLHKRGQLVRGLYGYAPSDRLKSADLEPIREQTTNRLNELVSKLRVFARAKHGVKWTAEQATDAIATYLSNFGIECLRGYLFQTPISKVVAHATQAVTFVVSSFITDAQANAPESFEDILVLVKGHMLANALLCPDLEKNTKKLSHLSVFLDTPLVLRLLKLSGRESYEAARETISLIKQLSGRVAIFSHTASEVYSVIRAVAARLNDPNARGPLVREMRQQQVSAVTVC